MLRDAISMYYFNRFIWFGIIFLPGLILAINKEEITTISSDMLVSIKQIHLFSNLINRRFYFIERLKKPIQMLLNMKVSSDQLNVIFHRAYSDSLEWRCDAVRTSLEEIERIGNLKPLLMVWDEFFSYKSIDDEIFIEEFTKEIFLIAHTLLIHGVAKSLSLDKVCEDLMFADAIFYLPAECLVEVIDHVASTLIESQFYTNLTDYLQAYWQRAELSDVVFRIYSNDIVMRFYVIERIEWIVDLFRQFEKMGNYSIGDGSLLEVDIVFKSYQINQAVMEINIEGGIKPFFYYWHMTKQYRFIKNELFQKEFLILVFILEKYLLNYYARSQSDYDTVQKIEEIYKKINSLSTFDLLQGIDYAGTYLKKIVIQQQNNWWHYVKNFVVHFFRKK